MGDAISIQDGSIPSPDPKLGLNMKVYMFRQLLSDIPNSEDYPSYLGFAVVKDGIIGLYWFLSEFGDPFSYQFCEPDGGDGVIFPVLFNGDGIDMVNDHATLSDNVEEADRHWFRLTGTETELQCEPI